MLVTPLHKTFSGTLEMEVLLLDVEVGVLAKFAKGASDGRGGAMGRHGESPMGVNNTQPSTLAGISPSAQRPRDPTGGVVAGPHQRVASSLVGLRGG